MSVFDRINQIENQISSLDTAFTAKANKAANGIPAQGSQQAVSFQNIIGSMTSDQRFSPTAARSASSAGQPASPSEFDGIISEASKKYNVDEKLIRAVIKQESGFNPSATSYCGAQGLMQLMPETAQGLGVKDAYDPRDNIMGGTRYLSQLLGQFDGNMTKTIAAYNAGPGAVQQFGGVPPYSETQDYVNKVLGYYEDAKKSS